MYLHPVMSIDMNQNSKRILTGLLQIQQKNKILNIKIEVFYYLVGSEEVLLKFFWSFDSYQCS